VLQCVAVCVITRSPQTHHGGMSLEERALSSVLQYVAECCSTVFCGALHYVTVCCSMLQYVVVRCSVLQCAAVCCSVLQCVSVCCSVLQYVTHLILHRCIVAGCPWKSVCVAVCCSMLQYSAVRCSALQCVAVRCSALQCVAVCDTTDSPQMYYGGMSLDGRAPLT